MGRSNAAKSMPTGTPFQAGPNARPGPGRPKGIVQQIREVTKDGLEIVRVVAEIMNNPKASNKDRLSAAEFLKNHGFGKAPDIALTGTLSESERSQVTAGLAEAELEAMARKLKPVPDTAQAPVLPMPAPEVSANPTESLDKPTD
jgi:hypothetical protein